MFMTQKTAVHVSFQTRIVTIGSWEVIKLPGEASQKLPSRGQVMVEGTINNRQFQTPLEPDGNFSHWFRVDPKVLKALAISTGDNVLVTITPTMDWPDPDLPADIRRAVESNPAVQAVWRTITPMARWEWLRWIRSTGRSETRLHRIDVACSKLSKGMRRPCCWNRNLCSEPSVSKNGVLLDPDNIPALIN